MATKHLQNNTLVLVSAMNLLLFVAVCGYLVCIDISILLCQQSFTCLVLWFNLVTDNLRNATSRILSQGSLHGPSIDSDRPVTSPFEVTKERHFVISSYAQAKAVLLLS